MGKLLSQFCNGLDIALLRKQKIDEKNNIPSVRAKRQLRSRFRGQTQTQFMNFGNGNGSAEAVSKPDVSTAIVRKFGWIFFCLIWKDRFRWVERYGIGPKSEWW